MDQTSAAPPAAGSLFDGVGDALRRARRLWWLTALVCLAAAGAGWAVGQRYHSETWQATGKLEFKPPAVAPDLAAFYTPTDLTTLTQQLKSRELLREVGQEFGLAAPVPTLDRALTVNRQRDSNLLEVTIEWPNDRDGTAIVARLMQRFIEQTARNRQREITRARLHGAKVTAEAKLRDTEKARTEAARRFEFAEQRLRELETHLPVDPDPALANDLRKAVDSLYGTERDLAYADRELAITRDLVARGAEAPVKLEPAENLVKRLKADRDRTKVEIASLRQQIHERPLVAARAELQKASDARREAEATVSDLKQELDRAQKALAAGPGEPPLDLRESEFRVESPAQAGDFPKSNRKKLTLTAAGAVLAGYLGLLFLTGRRRPTEPAVPEEMLPVPWALPRGPVVVVTRDDLTPPVTVTVLAPSVPPALPPARH